MDFYDWFYANFDLYFTGLSCKEFSKEAFEAGQKSNQDKIDAVLEYLRLKDGEYVIDIEDILNG